MDSIPYTIELGLENGIEGVFTRLFRVMVSREQIAERLHREVSRSSTRVVPNWWVAHLNPRDYSRFEAELDKHETSLSHSLQDQVSSNSNLVFRERAPARVRIVPDETVKFGRVNLVGSRDGWSLWGMDETQQKLSDIPANPNRIMAHLQSLSSAGLDTGSRIFSIRTLGRIPRAFIAVLLVCFVAVFILAGPSDSVRVRAHQGAQYLGDKMAAVEMQIKRAETWVGGKLHLVVNGIAGHGRQRSQRAVMYVHPQSRVLTHLRAGPSTRSRILACIPYGTRVSALRRTVKGRDWGRWYKVRVRGRSGYIYSPLLTRHRVLKHAPKRVSIACP